VFVTPVPLRERFRGDDFPSSDRRRLDRSQSLSIRLGSLSY